MTPLNRSFPKFQWVVLLTLLNTFIIFFGILPAYEDLTYFQSKNRQLKQKIQTLKHYSVLAEEHAKVTPANKIEQQKKYKKFKEENNEIFFLKGLQKIQQSLSQIELNQKTTKSEISEKFTHISTTHQFSAPFEVLIQYLEEINSSNTNAVLDHLSIENTEILQDNPNLTIQSQLSFYIKKS